MSAQQPFLTGPPTENQLQGEVSRLQAEVARLTEENARLKGKLAEWHPQLLILRSQIAALTPPHTEPLDECTS